METLTYKGYSGSMEFSIHEKPGDWTLKYAVQAKTPDEIQFKKNVAELSE